MRLRIRPRTVIKVPDRQCYPPDDDGRVLAALGGFCYVHGVPTKSEITHNVVRIDGWLFGKYALVKVKKRAR